MARVVLEANRSSYPRFDGLSESKVAENLPPIRERCYAVNHGQFVEGISGLAVPIQLGSGEAAVAIAPGR
jgi:DNA-binding IclR family transcriptional regulator